MSFRLDRDRPLSSDRRGLDVLGVLAGAQRRNGRDDSSHAKQHVRDIAASLAVLQKLSRLHRSSRRRR